MTDPTCWRLTELYDNGEGIEYVEKDIRSAEQLRSALESRSYDEPGQVSLANPSGNFLILGLGGPFAGMHWLTMKGPAQVDQFRRAKARVVRSPEPLTFACREELLEFLPAELLPVEEAIAAVVHFFEHARWPAGLEWE